MRVQEWPRSRQVGTFVAAVLVPLLQFLHLLRVLSERPPTWAAYSDPTYPYLLNGVLVVQGQPPGHTDHPGTSLQWLTGLISSAVHRAGGAGDSLAQSVVADPERYLYATGVGLSVLFCLALAFFGYRTCSHLGAAEGVVAVLLVSASVGLSLPWIVIVTPESLVLSSALILLGLLLPTIANRSLEPTLVIQLLAGVAIGVGITAKIVFLPMLLLLPFIMRIRRLLVIGATALIATAVILIPTYSQLGRMWSWFSGVASNPARYGDDGATQWTVSENLLRALGGVTTAMYSFWLVLIGTIIVMGLTLRRLGWSSGVRRLLPSVGLLASIVATLGLAYKDFATRDFILLAALVPMLAAVSLAAAEELNARSDPTRIDRTLTLVPIGTIAVAAVLALIASAQARAAMSSDAAAIEVERKLLVEMATDSPGAWTAAGYGVPTLTNALAFGNSWAGNAFAPNLSTLPARAVEYDMWGKIIYGWATDGQKVALDCDTLSRLAEVDGLRLVVRTPYVSSLDGIDSGLIRLSNGSTLVVDDSVTPRSSLPLTEFTISGCTSG